MKGGEAKKDNMLTVPLTSKNLRIQQVTVSSCDTAVGTEQSLENLLVENVSGWGLRTTGFQLHGIKNAMVKNCSFFGDPSVMVVDCEPDQNDPTTADYASSGFTISQDEFGAQTTGLVKNITICNCVFDFPQKFFRISQDRGDNCEGIRVKNCLFKVHHVCLSEKKTPAYIKGIVKDIRFSGCRFETDGFSTEAHSHNGVLFYFASRLADTHNILNKMHWFFDRCTFVNSGSVTVNSVALSLSGFDSAYKTAYCQIRNCLIEGFRWTMRVATTEDTTATVSSEVINPCFDDYGENDRASAVTNLNNKMRFVAKNNIYRRENQALANTFVYVNAEEYGI